MMLERLLCISLSAIPFIIWMGYGDGIRQPKEILSILSLVVISSVCVYNYTLKPFRNKWLLALLGWCVFTTILNNYFVPVYLGKVVLDMPSTLFAWKELFYILVAVFAIYTISSSEIKESFSLHKISSVISWTIIIMSVYAIIQALGFDEIFRVADAGSGFVASNPLSGGVKGAFTHRIVGMIGNPSILAIWLAICLPLCLHLKNRLGYVASGLGLLVILLTKSAMGVAGAGIGILIYSFFNNKKLFYILAVGSIIAGVVFMVNPSLSTFLNPSGRIEVHREAFEVLKKKPLFGMGLGTFEHLIGGDPRIVAKLGNQNWKELHDEVGQVWFSIGFIGLMVFMGFIIDLVRRFIKRRSEESIALFSSLASLFAISLCHFPLRVGPLSLYAVIFVGLFLKYTGE